MSDEHVTSVISKSCLEMLVDGIFAIAMTILVLDLKVPELAVRQSMHELGRAAAMEEPGREALVGPAAILEWEKSAVSQHPKAKITATTTELRIAASGDIAIQAGEGQLTNLGENGEDHAVHEQRFLTIWKKVNGEWKVAHDMAVNTTPWQ